MAVAAPDLGISKWRGRNDDAVNSRRRDRARVSENAGTLCAVYCGRGSDGKTNLTERQSVAPQKGLFTARCVGQSAMRSRLVGKYRWTLFCPKIGSDP